MTAGYGARATVAFGSLVLVTACQSSIPSDLERACVATEAVGSTVLVRGHPLSVMIEGMRSKGSRIDWAGNDSGGILTAANDDPLTGKTVVLKFEIEIRNGGQGSDQCGPQMAVITRFADQDGNVAQGFTAQDAIFSVVEGSANTIGAPAPKMSSNQGEAPQSAEPQSVAPPIDPTATSDSDDVSAGNESFDASESELIAAAESAWSDYRNGDEGAYDRHSMALDALLARNICWGKIDQPQVEFAFHRCSSDSLQKQLD